MCGVAAAGSLFSRASAHAAAQLTIDVQTSHTSGCWVTSYRVAGDEAAPALAARAPTPAPKLAPAAPSMRTLDTDMSLVSETWCPLAPCAAKRCAHSGRSTFSSSPGAILSSHTRSSSSCAGVRAEEAGGGLQLVMEEMM